MKVTLISPYHGGSHAAWAEGLRRHSADEVELLTLPDRFWKWRMHGGAATLARRFLRDDHRPDVLLATDMLDLSTFLGLTRRRTAALPSVLYMHENQLTYPLPANPSTGAMRRQGGERDHHYGFINYASMLAADHVAFNSHFHRDAWFDALPRFLRHFPEFNELPSVATLRAKSSVVPVGIEFPDTTPIPAADRRIAAAPLIVWNQRWEYDKDPEQLVRALREVADRGVDFRLALCGQAFGEAPAALVDAPAIFGERLVHYGFADAARYRELLGEALLTVSTAEHEFFGISVLEAMSHGAFAVLPERLSYPEILDATRVSAATRARCLYRTERQLVDRVAWALRHPEKARRCGTELRENARRFAWPLVVSAYEGMLAAVSAR